MSKKEKKLNDQMEEIHIDIPEDEIWSYRVEGLAEPHINKPYKHYGLKKFIFAIVIVIAVSLSMYFSVRTVQKDTFEYEETSIGIELSKYSNTGYMTMLDIDYVSHLEYDSNNADVNTNFTVVKDETQKIVSVGPYALNCDEKIQVINISADVVNIDPKAFYSCWALQRVEIDENNPNYCDVDGVIYSKDMTELIFVPCDHDTYRAEKYGHAEYDENGFRIEPAEDAADFEQYKKDVLTYVVPSSVKTIGQLAFNYANMTDVYLPEGVTTIETLGFFEIPRLANIYSYKSDSVTDTHFTSESALGEVYLSLPEGLEYIGSDCFSYNQAMTYVYIPESVTYIGHHAFWDTCYKDSGEIKGVNVINVAADEDTFKEIHLGDNWRPQYDYLLFKKSIDVNYSAQREAK